MTASEIANKRNEILNGINNIQDIIYEFETEMRSAAREARKAAVITDIDELGKGFLIENVVTFESNKKALQHAYDMLNTAWRVINGLELAIDDFNK